MSNVYNLKNTFEFNLFMGRSDFCKIINIHKFPFLILFLFALLGCQEQGTGPLITNVYIEEVDTFSSSEAIASKPEVNKNVEIDESSYASGSSADKLTEPIEKKTSVFEEEAPDKDVPLATEAIPEGQLALSPATVFQKPEQKFEVATPSDNASKPQFFEENEENKEKQTKLRKVALEAAFEMLARRAKPILVAPQTQIKETEDKNKTVGKTKFKIGLLVPLTGSFSYLGNTILGGSELAFFKMGNPNVELLYFDTAGGKKAVNAAKNAISNNVDVVIGPLFSDSVYAVKPLLKASDIPVLSFSNNIDVAEPGVWVLGYLPEQQITQLIDFAVARGKQNFGILNSNSQLGNKITNAAINQLAEYGLSARTVFELENISQMQQEELLSQIKTFTKYVDSSKDPLTLPPPAYDTLIIAGDTDFILQVAPILSYYDLGPDRVLFMGIDKWAQPKILNEPSLQNAVLTLPKRPAEEKFNKVWQDEFTFKSNDLAKISFDASALVIATSVANPSIPFSDEIAIQPGFIGFSGQFKMSQSGLTERVFEIMEISDNLLVQPSIQ